MRKTLSGIILGPALATGATALLWANAALASTSVPGCSVVSVASNAAGAVSCNYPQVDPNSVIHWLEHVGTILFAILGVVALFAGAQAVYAIWFSSDRDVHLAYQKLFRWALGALLLFSIATVLGLLRGLAP